MVRQWYSTEYVKHQKIFAPAENRTRGPTMATLDFTTKPLVPTGGRGPIDDHKLWM